MATPSAFQVPPIHKRKRIPMKTIRAIADHIAEKFDPEEIILFGSHAYGKPTAWSDVDLLVVMDTPKGGAFRLDQSRKEKGDGQEYKTDHKEQQDACEVRKHRYIHTFE